MKTELYRIIPILGFFLLFSPIYAQKNFANRVIDVSREYDHFPEAWCSSQMLGQPNVYPKWGDEYEAWASYDYGDERDTVILGFDNNGPIDSIFIWETYTAGYIDSVWVKNPGTMQWDLVYWTTPANYGDSSRILAIGFPMTAYNVNEVRFTLANDLADDWTEVDAVAISPGTPSPMDLNIAGNSIAFDGVDDQFQTLLPSKGIWDSAHATITAWIKINGSAPVTSSVYYGAGIVSISDAYAGIYHTNVNGLDSIYFYSHTYDDYAFGMDYSPGEWMHIAYVHDLDTLLAYRNGVLYNKIYCPPRVGFYGGFIEIGYNYYNDAYFNGEIESVTIYDRALSTDEIRESIHITPTPTTTGLKAHFNFNKNTSYYGYGYNAMIEGSPTFSASEVPVGPGAATSLIVNTGNAQFTNTGITADYSAHPGDGEVTVSRIEDVPFTPQSGPIVDSIYWVFNQFNYTNFTADLIVTTNDFIYTTGVSDCRYTLYSRPVNDAGSWSYIDTASVLTSASLTFENIDQSALGQLMIVREGNCDGIGVDDLTKDIAVLIFPNPSTGYVTIKVDNTSENHLTILNNMGQAIHDERFEHSTQIHLPAGVYFAHLMIDGKYITEKIIISK
jgi:hypothetical protein